MGVRILEAMPERVVAEMTVRPDLCTAGGIMPLVEIDGRAIGDGKPGPVSERIHGLYWALRESGRYGTPIFPESAG